jgi:hypothetical protein
VQRAGEVAVQTGRRSKSFTVAVLAVVVAILDGLLLRYLGKILIIALIIARRSRGTSTGFRR